MPNFIVRVGTTDGEISDRQVDALNAAGATEEMRRQGLHVFSAKRTNFKASDLIPRSRKIVSVDRFLLFNQELLALIKAGLPIVQSFDIMLERERDVRFRGVLQDIREKLKSGVALSDAFASYGEAFPPIYANSLRAGERSGDLEGVVRRFLKYQKLIAQLRRRVVGALVYPAVLITLSFGMIFVMLTYVIPKFAEFYAGFGADLPPVTRFVINISALVRENSLLAVSIVAAVIFGLQQWSRSAAGGVAIDAAKLKIPMVGGILHRFGIMQFTQSLATLIAGGTPLVPSLEIASQSVTNRLMETRLASIAQKVREGDPLWQSLDATRVMSDLAVQMVKVGESSGSLGEMLTNVSEFYDEEIEARLARMIALIEPLILVGLGIVIAGLLYAFYLPLFQLSNVAQ